MANDLETTGAQRRRVKKLIGDFCSPVGEFVDCVAVSDAIYEMRYVNLTPGYEGWFWSAAVNQQPDGDLNVLEVYPSPGPSALVLTSDTCLGDLAQDDCEEEYDNPIDRDGLDFE